MSVPPDHLSSRDGAVRLIATAAVLGILYLGRDVLVPVTLAVMLSFIMLPLVQRLRRLGLGQTSSVLAAVLAVALGLMAIAGVIGTQLVRMAAQLPQYELTVKDKVETLRQSAVRRGEAALGLAVTPPAADATTDAPDGGTAAAPNGAVGAGTPPLPAGFGARVLSAPEAAGGSLQFLQRVMASLWVPLRTAGTVLVVLIFVLLEHESLRDRLIRIIGGTDIRTTTNVINDAGTRLSRFFGSQFAVNLGVGLALWLGLLVIGIPHALLWATMAAVLRFVPYIGVWIAALLCVLFATAVDPGWSIALMTALLFICVELIAGQLVEPQLFGHATGLSPLSVVIAAIFWSWLWGPIGLIVSTPLTLCLLVAGRNTRALNLLDVLLGDTPALTLPQRLYQRALSGDSDEIIASARIYLKRNSLAVYCDNVLIPAMYLTAMDFGRGAIDVDQQVRVRSAITNVIATLANDGPRPTRRQQRSSVLQNVNLGRALRAQRELRAGRWQGPLAVPPNSITLCVGLDTRGDELATEVLVRVLRHHQIDARHVTVAELRDEPPPGASLSAIGMIYIVCAFHSEGGAHAAQVLALLRERFPGVWICALLIPALLATSPPEIAAEGGDNADQAVHTFHEAETLAVERYRNQSATS
jgi:predicted PurR-regulated permease PerM